MDKIAEIAPIGLLGLVGAFISVAILLMDMSPYARLITRVQYLINDTDDLLMTVEGRRMVRDEDVVIP